MSNKNRLVHYRLPTKEYVAEEQVPIFDPNTIVVLMHFDDSDFPYFDESCGKSWIAYNSPTISEEHAKFGKALQFNGIDQMIACGQSDTWPDITRFNFGEKDFTIDFWAYIDSSGATDGVLMSFADNGSFSYPELIIARSDSKLRVMNKVARSDFSANREIYSNADILDKLIHVALVYIYSSKILSLYIDGKKEAEMENAAVSRGSNCKYHTEIGAFGINSKGSNRKFFKGTIDELRVLDGVARWTENFTPPTEPYDFTPTWEEEIIQTPVTALLHFNESVTKDECGNVWTISGSPVISTDQSKFGGKSLYLDGSSYLLCENPPLRDFSNDWTIDFWYYVPSANVARFRTMFSAVESASNFEAGILFWEECYNFTNQVSYRATTSSFGVIINQNNEAILTNQWVHVAMVKNGNNYYVFQNGILKKSVTSSSIPANALNYCIGHWYSRGESFKFIGYIDEFRISPIARWTENFTPPTEPYTVVPVEDSSTVQDIKFYSVPTEKPRLVLNGANHTKTYAALVEPQIVDYSNSDTIALLHFDDESNPLKDECGNTWKCDETPIIISENAKFGKSLGNSTIYIEDFAPGGGDCTIDFWARRDNSNGMFFWFDATNAYNSIGYGLTTSNGWLGWQSDRATERFADIDFSVWHHYAVVNDKVYVDGVLQGSNAVLFVAGRSYNLYVYGIVEDFRISKSAVWTENFTPPTKSSEMAGVNYTDNPYASDISIRIGTAENDVRAVAKSKKPTTLSLGTNAVNVTANSLVTIVQIDINGKGGIDSSREIVVTSNKPEIVTAYYSAIRVGVIIRAKDEAGTAIISVQVAENENYEASPVQTITVGNYAFGPLNTCTPDEIQACTQLRLAPVTWAVGDDTAGIHIDRFAVGGRKYYVWATKLLIKI